MRSFIERVQITHIQEERGQDRWEDVGLGNLVGCGLRLSFYSDRVKSLKYSTSLYATLVELNESGINAQSLLSGCPVVGPVVGPAPYGTSRGKARSCGSRTRDGRD